MSYCDFLSDVYRRQRAAIANFGLVQIGDVDGEQISLELAHTHCGITTFEEGSPPAAVSDYDDWLTDVGIPAAREYCEAYLGRALAPRTMEYVTNAFPGRAVSTPPGACFELPFGPIQSITSIKYLDDAAAAAAYTMAYDAAILSDPLDVPAAVAAGDAAAAAALEQTVAPTVYTLDSYGSPTQLILAYGQSWPTARNAQNSVKVRYVAGYSLPDDSPQAQPLPRMARAAMLMMLAHFFENREAVAAGGAGGTLLHEIPLGVKAVLDLIPGKQRIDFA